MRPLLLIAFLWLAAIASAQNRFNKDSLPVGKWTEITRDESGGIMRQETGIYKIVPLSAYDTIRELGARCYEVKYKGSTPLLFYNYRHGDDLAVKDGAWDTSDSTGKVHGTDFWEQGLQVWTKYYDDDGNLTRYEYDDLENDTSFYLTYKGGRVFRKAFYPPENKNEQTVLYYPDNQLVIGDAQPQLYRCFLDTAEEQIYRLPVSAKKDLQVFSVSTESVNLKPDFSTGIFPVTVPAGDTVIFPFRFRPAIRSVPANDAIQIVTSEPGISPYVVYCSIGGSHITEDNVEDLKQVTFSRSKDRYLMIAPMGTVTTAYISRKGVEHTYEIYGTTKIDLKWYKPGKYRLFIASCNTGGNMVLNITK